MPLSVFLGRPLPAPGEPLFLDEDTAWAIALAEEERDTCPTCGMPISVCSSPDYQFAFEPKERICWSTYRLATYQASGSWKSKPEVTKQALQLSTRFREGQAAPVDYGLDLGEGDVDESPVVPDLL